MAATIRLRASRCAVVVRRTFRWIDAHVLARLVPVADRVAWAALGAFAYAYMLRVGAFR